MATCFSRLGIEIPVGGGDCVCGEYVRFDLVHRRAAHFLVCPEVDRIMSEVGLPDDVDEAAVKIGMEAVDAVNQDRGSVQTEQGPEATVDNVAQGTAGSLEGRR